MTLRTAFGAQGAEPSEQSALSYRRAVAGMLVRNASGVPRYGVFAPGVTGSGRSDMSINVNQFLAAVGRGAAYGAVILANDGTEQPKDAAGSVLFHEASPSSNSRIDTVWVRQNDVTQGNADNKAVYGIAKGTAAAVPVPPAVPTGALPLLNVKLPANVLTTNAAGVTITQAAPFTAAAGGVVRVKDEAERDAANFAVGQPFWMADKNILQIRGSSLNYGVGAQQIGGLEEITLSTGSTTEYMVTYPVGTFSTFYQTPFVMPATTLTIRVSTGNAVTAAEVQRIDTRTHSGFRVVLSHPTASYERECNFSWIATQNPVPA